MKELADLRQNIEYFRQYRLTAVAKFMLFHTTENKQQVEDLDRHDRRKLHIGFIMLEKFTLNAFSGFIEAVRLAADQGGRSRQIHCGWDIMGPQAVTASCGLMVTPTSPLIDPAAFDYIAICGGNNYLAPQPDFVEAYLKAAHAARIPLIGLCTGTFNIAGAGLMSGYVACVHWNVVDAFRERFPAIKAVTDRIFIDAGQRVTCAGSSGASDLALHLIARHCGHERAKQSIRHMMLQDIRPSTLPQAHFYSEIANVKDIRVRRAVHFMEQALNDPPSIASLAQRIGTSQRQLERLFLMELRESPASYFRKMRLRYGAWMLTHTLDRIVHIAVDSGFADAAHFSREFKALYGLTPRQYRSAHLSD